MIDQFFNWCVWVLVVINNVTGIGYELANIVIFVVLQPALILWKGRRKKIKDNFNMKKLLGIVILG